MLWRQDAIGNISHSFCTRTPRHSGWLLLAVRMPGWLHVKLGSLSAKLTDSSINALSLSAAKLAEILYCTACASADYPLMTGHGPPQFRAKGKVYHQIGRLLSVIGQAPNFSQMCIHQCTSSLMSGRGRGGEIISFLQAGLLRVNPFVQQSRTAAESAQTGDNMELITRPDTANITRWSYRDVTAAREVALLPHQPVVALHDIVVMTLWSSQGMAACSASAKAMLHTSLFSFPFCASVLSMFQDMFQAQIPTPKPAFVAAKQQQQHQEFAAFQEQQQQLQPSSQQQQHREHCQSSTAIQLMQSLRRAAINHDRTTTFLDCHINVENCIDAKRVKHICTSTSVMTIVQLN